MFIFYLGASFVLINFFPKGPGKNFYVVKVGFQIGQSSVDEHSAPLDLRREKKIVQAYATCQTSFRGPVNILVIIYKSHAGQNPTFTT